VNIVNTPDRSKDNLIVAGGLTSDHNDAVQIY